MKIAYIFATPRAASYKLGQMILPQLEAGTHGVEVGCFPDLYAALAPKPPDQVITL